MTGHFRLFFFFVLSTVTSQASAQWVEVNNGIYGGAVLDLMVDNSKIYAGTLGGAFLSTDEGESWTGISNGIDHTFVTSFTVNNGVVLAATNGGSNLFASSNGGVLWTPLSNTPENFIIELASMEGKIYALSNNSILYTSIDNGVSWNEEQLEFSNIRSLETSDGQVFLGTDTGVYKSGNNGISWTPINSGLSDLRVIKLSVSENYMIAGTFSGVYFSNDNGDSWSISTLAFGHRNLANNGSTLMTGYSDKVYVSNNGGVSWTIIPEVPNAYSLVFSGTAFLCGSTFGIYKSSDDGVSWSIKNDGLKNSSAIAFSELNGRLFVATGIGVFRTEDNGSTWVPVNNGLPLEAVFSITAKGNNLVVCLNSGIFYSTNYGESWVLASSFQKVRSFAHSNSRFLAGGRFGIYESVDDGVSWDLVSAAVTSVSDLIIRGDSLIASSIFGVKLSLNGGQTWVNFNDGIPNFVLPETLMSYKNDLFLGAGNMPVFIAAGFEEPWRLSRFGMSIFTGSSTSFAITDKILFVATDGGVYTTWDNGATWNQMDNDFPIPQMAGDIASLLISNDKLFVGTRGNGVWKWTGCFEPPSPEISVQPGTQLQSSSILGNQWFLDGNILTGENSNTLTVTKSGAYTVSVTIDGCTSKQSSGTQITLPPSAPIVQVTHPTCGQTSGSITVSMQENMDLYSFDGGITFQTSNSKSGLTAGSYQVIAKNAGGNSPWTLATINQPPGIPTLPEVSIIHHSCLVNKGAISVTVQNVSDSYSFDGGVTYQASNTKPELESGEYLVIIRNIEGCTNSIKAIIMAPVTPVKPTLALSIINGQFELTASNAFGYQWYKDGVLIEGANSSSITASFPGSYTVVVLSAGGCASVHSDPKVIAVTGDIGNLNIANVFRIYPNPAHTYVEVEGVSDSVQCTILNSAGNSMLVNFYWNNIDGKIKIDTRDFASGLYFLKLIDRDVAIYARFIKH